MVAVEYVYIRTSIHTVGMYSLNLTICNERADSFSLNCEYVCIHTRKQIPFKILPARCACTYIHAQCSCFLLCCVVMIDSTGL